MTLTAITPNDTTRYAGRQTSTLSHTVIPGILDSQTVETELPQYLPVQWSAHIHPEGQRYFYRKAEPLASSDFDVVTEANMYCEETATQVLSTIKEVQDRISTSNVKLPNGAELLLQAMDEDGCGYYFADHGLRRLFWLETLDTETLGLSAVASASHLEQCLTSMYWCHVEYFPMHRSTVDVAFVDEITAVLSHAHLDILTSATSTFPFSIEKCNQLAKLLRNSRGQTSDGHVAWMTARVAALIYEHRISIQFGESTARLGLDQSLFPEPNFEDSRMNKILSCLTFSGSNLCMSRLNSLFIDRTVYTRQWKPFWARSLKEWKNISTISMALLLLHVLLGYVGGAIPGLVVASATFVGLSTLSSLLLSLQHTDKEEESISRSHSYLEQARSETSGFTSTAFLFALPKASLLWGLLFFTVNWVAILIHYTPVNFAPAPLLCISAFAITSVALLRIRKLWRILSFRRFYSEVDDCSDLV